MKPGMHDTSLAEYLSIEAVNAGSLEALAQSPAHARERQLHPPDATTAQELGSAVHAAVLEPERFAADYAPIPKFEGHHASNEHKAEKATWLNENATKIALKAPDYKLCCDMRDAAWANSDVQCLLKGQGMNEKTVVWKDVGTELLCKARMDRFTKHRDWSTVVDLKTTRNASFWAFRSDISRYGYHRKAAFYLRGLNVLAPMARRFLFIAIEKIPPYCSAVYELNRDALMAAEEQMQQLLYKHAKCVETNSWPGYPSGIMPVDLPAWALNGRYNDE